MAAASGQRRPGLILPRRNRRYRFSMTPLADVMFQLLIFFMLSANLAAYSLLPLRSGALQEVLPAHAGASRPFSLLYPAHRHMPLRVRVLVDFIVQRIAAG